MASFHTHIVTEPAPGWILRRLSESFAHHLPRATVGETVDRDADVNLYVNYALYSTPTKCDVGYFTHRDVNSPYTGVFDECGRTMDHCIAMCAKTAMLLPPEKTSIVKPGPDPRYFKRPVRFGVVARHYDTGRKRLDWIPQLHEATGAHITLSGGNLSFEELNRFYAEIDYLVVLSDNEGGPMPVLEALALGKPVIAPDVGFVGDYTTIRYETFEQLVRIIKGLQIPPDAWKIAGSELLSVLGGVLKRTSR